MNSSSLPFSMTSTLKRRTTFLLSTARTAPSRVAYALYIQSNCIDGQREEAGLVEADNGLHPMAMLPPPRPTPRAWFRFGYTVSGKSPWFF